MLPCPHCGRDTISDVFSDETRKELADIFTTLKQYVRSQIEWAEGRIAAIRARKKESQCPTDPTSTS